MASTGEMSNVQSPKPLFSQSNGPALKGPSDTPVLPVPADATRSGLDQHDGGSTRQVRTANTPVTLVSFEWSGLSHSDAGTAQKLQTGAQAPPQNSRLAGADHDPISAELNFGVPPMIAAPDTPAGSVPWSPTGGHLPQMAGNQLAVMREMVFGAPAAGTGLEPLLADCEHMLSQLTFLVGHPWGSDTAITELGSTVAALRNNPKDLHAKEGLYQRLINLREALGALPLSTPLVSNPLTAAFEGFTRDPDKLTAVLKSQGVASVGDLQRQLGIDPPSGVLDARTFVRMEAVLLEGLAVDFGRNSGVATMVAVESVERVQQSASFVQEMTGSSLDASISANSLSGGALAHLDSQGYAVADGHLTEKATGRILSASETDALGARLLDAATTTLAEDYDTVKRDEVIHKQALSGPALETYERVRKNLDQMMNNEPADNVADGVIQAYLDLQDQQNIEKETLKDAKGAALQPVYFDHDSLIRWSDGGMTGEELTRLPESSQKILKPFLEKETDGKQRLRMSKDDIAVASKTIAFVKNPPSPAARHLIANIRRTVHSVHVVRTMAKATGTKLDTVLKKLQAFIDRLTQVDAGRRQRLKAAEHAANARLRSHPLGHMSMPAAAHDHKPGHSKNPVGTRPDDPDSEDLGTIGPKSAVPPSLQAAFLAADGDRRWGTRLSAERLTRQLRQQKIVAEVRTVEETYAESVVAEGREKAIERRDEALHIVRPSPAPVPAVPLKSPPVNP